MVRAAALALIGASISYPAAGHMPPAGTQVWHSSTNGSQVMSLCGQTWEYGKYDPCGSYLMGVIDALSVSRVFCPPDGGGLQRQLSTLAYGAIKADPARWHQPATFLIAEKLGDAFPCRK